MASCGFKNCHKFNTPGEHHIKHLGCQICVYF